MKVFYLIVISSLALYSNSLQINSTDFLESCVTEYQTNQDVKLVESWYEKMINMSICDKSQIKQLLNDKVYTKNSILMLKFKMETKECKEALERLNNNFSELVSYIKVQNSPDKSCNDKIPSYWTHLLSHKVDIYKKASLYSEIIETLKKGMKLKIIAYDMSQKWGEFKYESNGQSLTGWIKLSEVERIDE